MTKAFSTVSDYARSQIAICQPYAGGSAVPSSSPSPQSTLCFANLPTAPAAPLTTTDASSEAQAGLSAKSSWIRAGGGHRMLGLDRSAGKRPEESDVPGDIHAQIEGDGLVQTVVCRG